MACCPMVKFFKDMITCFDEIHHCQLLVFFCFRNNIIIGFQNIGDGDMFGFSLY